MLCADGNLYIVVGKQSASPLIFKNCVCFCVGRVHVEHFRQLCSICRYRLFEGGAFSAFR